MRPLFYPPPLRHLISILASGENHAIIFAVHWIVALHPERRRVFWRSLPPKHWIHLSLYHRHEELMIPDIMSQKMPVFTASEIPPPSAIQTTVVVLDPQVVEKQSPSKYEELMTMLEERQDITWMLFDRISRTGSPLARLYDDRYLEVTCNQLYSYETKCRLPRNKMVIDKRWQDERWQTQCLKLEDGTEET